jgi:hypothetical protein
MAVQPAKGPHGDAAPAACKVLRRHQMLHTMYLTFGQPTFRPQSPEGLGTGVRWAFDGEPGHGVLRGPDGVVMDPATIEGMPEFVLKAKQLTGMMLLAGPGDEEVGELREHYGYRPEAMTEVEASRLEWEASCRHLSGGWHLRGINQVFTFSPARPSLHPCPVADSVVDGATAG